MEKKIDIIVKDKGGRPAKYNQEMLALTDKYIIDAELDKTKLPKIESLSIILDVEKPTLYNWAKKYPVFKKKMKKIMSLQLERLIDDGVYGGKNINPAIVKLMLINNHDMKSDKIDNNLTGKFESKFNDKQIEKIASRINRRHGENGDISISK